MMRSTLTQKNILIILLIVAILISGLVLTQHFSINNPTTRPTDISNPFAMANSKPQTGSIVPDFSLYDILGNKVDIKQFRGKPVILNFWATWCAPCKLEMPLFLDIYEQQAGNLVVLAVNKKETVETIDTYVKNHGLTFTVLLDSDGLIAKKNGVNAFPTTFFIDKEGIIQSQHVGQLDKNTMADYLKLIGIVSW